jgi:hypothetical protein
MTFIAHSGQTHIQSKARALTLKAVHHSFDFRNLENFDKIRRDWTDVRKLDDERIPANGKRAGASTLSPFE